MSTCKNIKKNKIKITKVLVTEMWKLKKVLKRMSITYVLDQVAAKCNICHTQETEEYIK